METITPLHAQPSMKRDPAARRALLLIGATFLCILAGFFGANAVVARRIDRIVQNGGLVRSWSDYIGDHAFQLLGYRVRGFYEDHYVIRDQYEVYLGDLERAYVGCGTGITFADAPMGEDNRPQDHGDEGPKLVHDLGRVYRASFAETSVTDAGLAPLAGMTTIESLDLSATRVAGPGLVHLRGMPLWNLSLESTPLDDAGLALLPDFPELRHLSLGNTRISSTFVAQLRRYPKLTHLNLKGLPITDEIVRELSSFPLKELDLSDTQVTRAAIPHLEKMPTLQWLTFCNTKLVKEIAENETSEFSKGWNAMHRAICPPKKTESL